VFILDQTAIDGMITPAEEQSVEPSIKDTPMHPIIDHNFIACLECRFKGTWQSDSAGNYSSVGEASELRIVRMDGTKRYLAFKNGARVSMIFPNVISYEEGDVEEDIDIEEKSS